MTYKKAEKEINEFIKNENNVPDSVLDSARKTMSKYQTNIKPKKSILLDVQFYIPILTALIIIVSLCIVVPIVVENYYKNNSTIHTYHYEDLDKVENESIEEYNHLNKTKFLFLTMTTISKSYILKDGDNFVGVEEHSTYNQYLIEEYVFSSKENIDIFSKTDWANIIIINDTIFWYDFYDNSIYAYALFIGNAYYLNIKNTSSSEVDQDTFRQILTNLTESRQD